MRAFIANGACSRNYEGGNITTRDADDPMFVLTTDIANRPRSHMPRAFIVGGANTSEEQAAPGVGVSESDEPTRCVASNSNSWKAFIVDDQNGGTPNEDGERDLTIRNDDNPIFTASATQTKQSLRAFVMDSKNAHQEWGNGRRDSGNPIMTITADHPPRAWFSNGRVVAMVPRCLARFQSFPDTYILPESNDLACRVIGDAVPPLLYQRVIEAQLS